ncbi:MAG: hypothetical protein EZS28_015472 [Streblomastix strix]|uniref:Uncharacterized protein n=1 Tax=Streblomastix strix TaxID=222440 RepID=A0A5J4W261_9EUKA|nr:MAG: hypothetical protein EZS28_015472 [Streblomastix strix]
MYDTTWYNSGQVVPDQVSPASDAVPLVDNATGAAGVSNEYARGDHQHPLQISSVLPSADTATGEAGTAATYARSDHTHHVNLSNDIPLKDSGTGTSGTSNIYASTVHQHPLNIDPTVANVPLVNATAAANGTSDFYCRNDHVHPQQLTYDGNITATKFIKTGGLATEILCANGDTTAISTIDSDSVKKTGYLEQSIAGKLKRTDSTESFDDLTDDQYTTKYTIQGAFVKKRGKTLQEIQGVLRHSGDDEESEDDEDYITRGTIYNQYVSKASPDTIIGRKIFKNDYFQIQPASSTNPLILFKNNNNLIEQMINSNEIILSMNTTDPAGTPLYINYRGTSLSTQYPNSKLVQKYVLNAGSSTSYAGVISGNVQINPSSIGGYDDGLRISRTVENTGSVSIQLGCSRTSNSGSIDGQWVICSPPINSVQAPYNFIIAVASQAQDLTRGLQISADGNTLSFNGQVIAQTNPTTGQTTISSSSNGAANGSVNYSAGNPILWGANSVDTNGGFYSNGTNICWRAHPLTQGSVPP